MTVGVAIHPSKVNDRDGAGEILDGGKFVAAAARYGLDMGMRTRAAVRPGAERAPGPYTRSFPERVTILVDRAAGVTLRATTEADLPALLEQLRDPETARWTSLALPPDGFAPADAQAVFQVIRRGWATGRRLSWTIEAERAGVRQFCGTIHLRVDSPLLAEIGFALHPGARGRGLMTAAARLVRDFGFDVVGLEVIRWRAAMDNWASRRVAAATGFVIDGAVRRLVPHGGGLEDGWLATLTRDDPRVPRPWLEQPQLTGAAVTLRRFGDGDIDRVVEACGDLRTQYWLVSVPQPYRREHAVDYLRLTRELAAQSLGLVWCIADPATDRCLGSISLEGLGGYAGRAEIGYWTHPQVRGRGVMTESVGLVTGHAQALCLARSIMIRCAATNTASRHVAEAAGYHQIGVQPASEPLRDGSVADLVLYARSVTSVTAGHPDLTETKL